MVKYGPEDLEQITLVEWLQLTGLKHWHPIQEQTIKQPAYWGKQKRMGWNAGLSDMIVYLPPERCLTSSGALIFIELKKPRTRKKSGEFYALSSDGISTSDAQQEFIEMVNSVPGCQACVAYGWEEARDFVVNFLSNSKPRQP